MASNVDYFGAASKIPKGNLPKWQESASKKQSGSKSKNNKGSKNVKQLGNYLGDLEDATRIQLAIEKQERLKQESKLINDPTIFEGAAVSRQYSQQNLMNDANGFVINHPSLIPPNSLDCNTSIGNDNLYSMNTNVISNSNSNSNSHSHQQRPPPPPRKIPPGPPPKPTPPPLPRKRPNFNVMQSIQESPTNSNSNSNSNSLPPPTQFDDNLSIADPTMSRDDMRQHFQSLFPKSSQSLVPCSRIKS